MAPVSPCCSSFLPASSDSWRARSSPEQPSSRAADTGGAGAGRRRSAPCQIPNVQKFSDKVKDVCKHVLSPVSTETVKFT